MTAILIDTSHWNAIPNWAALRAGGVVGLIAKASEGVGYADPNFGAFRSGAEGNGFAFGAYHFARLGDPAAEAAWFVRCIGSLRPGEFVGLDLEVSAAGVDPVAWVGRWLDAMAALGVPVRLLYLNKSELGSLNWAPIVARGVLLWLAAYDGQPTPVSSGQWPTLTLKQYTDRGTVPGEAGTVDVDVLFGTLTDLTGGPDMPLTDADVQKLWWAATVDPATGQPVQIIQLLKNAELAATNAARDAAVARKLAESAAAGVTLSKAQIDAIAAEVAADLSTGYKIAVVPAAAAT